MQTPSQTPATLSRQYNLQVQQAIAMYLIRQGNQMIAAYLDLNVRLDFPASNQTSFGARSSHCPSLKIQ